MSKENKELLEENQDIPVKEDKQELYGEILTELSELLEEETKDEDRLDKYTLAEQIEDLRKTTGLSIAKINRILYQYRFMVVTDLHLGINFRFGYIAHVFLVGTESAEAEKPLGYMARLIAEETDVPYFTILGLLKEYIRLAEINLRKGKSFGILGILKLRPILDEDGKVVNISASLSRSLGSKRVGDGYKLRARVLPNVRNLIVESAE